MAKKNGNGQPTDIFNPKYKKYDLTDPANYEEDYPVGDYGNVVDKIYGLPDIDDMAGVILRGRFKNEQQANACLRLMYRHDKFGDIPHQKLLRAKIATTAAIGGVRSLEALFGSIQLLASDMYRAVLGMPKRKKGDEEQVIRGSSFNQPQQNQPPNGVLGAGTK